MAEQAILGTFIWPQADANRTNKLELANEVSKEGKETASLQKRRRLFSPGLLKDPATRVIPTRWLQRLTAD